MKRIAGIAYAPEHGERGTGDLYLPEGAGKTPVAMAIHGGGWNAMDKGSWAGVAEFMCEQGYAVFNINYRLLDTAPWPACGDDCLAAAKFVLEGGHEALAPLDRKGGLVIIGGSAGGHLTLMTGLRLAKGQCRGMVNVSGPTDFHIKIAEGRREQLQQFFGAETITEQMLYAASPVSYVKPWSPPLLCTHSVHDKLVSIEHSRQMIKFYHEVHARAELYAYAGPGEQHGIWIEGSEPHRLLPEIEEAIATFLKTV
ncbi:MAG: alpha/beta hydrolase fold domain-containing protein [Phycisphaerae bacterium]|nr:alpha/beta hydrolase fold domain-containing protein [Phycisphaerae bacterium]